MALPASSASPARKILDLLPPGVWRGHSRVVAPAVAPTGDEALDRLLGGGFPRGRLSEVFGPRSSGHTSLLHRFLAAATERGEIAGLVDPLDRFDPASAAAAGVDLGRVLWVRPRDVLEALRAAEILLDAGGFGAVVLDLVDGLPPVLARRLDGAWARLAQRASATDAVLLLLDRERVAGGSPHLCLALSAGEAIWLGLRDEGARHPLRVPLLAGLRSRIAIERARRGALGGEVALSFAR